MDKGKGRLEAGRTSNDILSRIRETAASKPEHQIRQLTEENRRLVHELGISHVDLARLQGEQDQLVEAYDALEKRHDDDVRRLTKELEKLSLGSVALEKERGGLKPNVLDLSPPDELNVKDTANKPKQDDDGTVDSGNDASLMTPPEKRMQQLEDEVRRLNEELDEAKTEIESYRSRYNDVQLALEHANLEQDRLKEVVQTREIELRGLEEKLRGAQDSLATIQGKEPMGLGVSTAKADSVLVSEVIERVSRFNKEIFQAAALLGESLRFEPKNMSLKETKECSDDCTKILGCKLTEILANQAKRGGTHDVDPFLARLTLQALLSRFFYAFVDCWEPDDSDTDGFLEEMYKKIIDSEDPIISGHWRTLTRKHIRPSTDTWMNRILGGLQSICDLANWILADKVTSRAFGQRLTDLFEAAEGIRAAISKQTMSADIGVSITTTDRPFLREYIEDVYASGDGGSLAGDTTGRAPSTEIVLATVGLGVKRVSKHRLRDGGIDIGYHSDQSPKVVLVSTVLKVLASPPRTKSRVRIDSPKH